MPCPARCASSVPLSEGGCVLELRVRTAPVWARTAVLQQYCSTTAASPRARPARASTVGCNAACKCQARHMRQVSQVSQVPSPGPFRHAGGWDRRKLRMEPPAGTG